MLRGKRSCSTCGDYYDEYMNGARIAKQYGPKKTSATVIIRYHASLDYTLPDLIEVNDMSEALFCSKK